MNKLLIATSNPAKLAEFKNFLSDLSIKLVSLTDLNITQKAAETGDTFAENALIKAKFYSRLSGLATLADDGGFEIDILGGQPGVKSHRWVSQKHEDTDEEIINYTLQKLKGVPKAKRGAQLRLVLALVLPSGQTFTVEEKIRGIVAKNQAPKTTAGFPFRALLFLPEINKFYDQNYLTVIENERYNHRKRAAEKLKPIIKQNLI